MRILAVDPGDKRIGIALSDPTSTIANPLTVIKHISRSINAASIAQLAKENQAALIIVKGKSIAKKRKKILKTKKNCQIKLNIMVGYKNEREVLSKEKFSKKFLILEFGFNFNFLLMKLLMKL